MISPAARCRDSSARRRLPSWSIAVLIEALNTSLSLQTTSVVNVDNGLGHTEGTADMQRFKIIKAMFPATAGVYAGPDPVFGSDGSVMPGRTGESARADGSAMAR